MRPELLQRLLDPLLVEQERDDLETRLNPKPYIGTWMQRKRRKCIGGLRQGWTKTGAAARHALAARGFVLQIAQWIAIL